MVGSPVLFGVLPLLLLFSQRLTLLLFALDLLAGLIDYLSQARPKTVLELTQFFLLIERQDGIDVL